MKVLPFRRSSRKPVSFIPDPHRCHCVVRHPVTAVERNLALAGIDRARAAGDRDHAGYLRTLLDTAHRCPAYSGPKCPCGCGSSPGQHNPMNGDAA